MKLVETRGSHYYGNGVAYCFDCHSGGKILKEIGGGKFERNDVSEEEIGLLVHAALEHMRAKNHFNIRIHTFYRNEGETTQETSTI